MAFPGGRREPGDGCLLETAIRETREEIGLDLSAAAEPLGVLPELEAIARGRPTGMIIAPFVFELVGEFEAANVPPNAEVDEVLWVPLSRLASGELDAKIDYVHQGQRLALPAWDLDGRVIWGLTHRMLGSLIELLP